MIQFTQTRAKNIHRISFREHGKTIITAWSGIFCFMFASVVLAQDNALPYVLSSRVGEDIDRSERDYFGLFPSAKDFVSARSFAHTDGRVEFMITWQTNEGISHSTFTINAENAEVLRGFVEDFEMVLRKERQVRWDLIAGLARVPSFAYNDGVEMTITTRGGEQHTGTVLYATDSLLVLWQSTDPYNWRNLKSSGKTVRFSEIEHIVIKREGRFWSGLGYGALIGGGLGAVIGLASGDDTGGLFRLSAGAKALLLSIGLGIPAALAGGITGAIQGTDEDFVMRGNAETYKAIVPALKEDAIFSSLPPPELQTFVKHKGEEILKPSLERISQTSTTLSEPSPGKFHVSLGGGWMTSRANNDIIDAFNASGFGGTVGGWFGPTHYPVDHSSPFTWNLGTEYSLTDQFRLGLVWNRIPEQEISGKDYEVEHARATSMNFFADYVVLPVDPQLLSRYEFAIGAGLSYNWLSVDGTLSALFGSAIVNRPIAFAVSKGVVGVNLRGSLDYYISRNVSLQGRIEERFIRAIEVPSVTHVNPYNSATKTLNRHSVDFSGLDFSLGLRFHL
jgi:hypothetical protein